MAWNVEWKVIVNGDDVTEAMRPFLMDIEVTDKAGTSSDQCSLTLDDTDGQIKLPEKGASVVVVLQGATVFEGTVDTVNSSGSRSAGRTIKVSAKGFDTRDKAKQGQSFHKDDASLEDFLGQSAKNAGYSLTVDPDLANINRAYWSSEGESFLALGARLGRELNGTFKLRGKKAVLMKRGNSPLPTVRGIVGPGGNVISWDIAPFQGRRAFGKTKVQWFDRKEGQFKTEETDSESDDEGLEAENVVRGVAADEDHAKQIAEGRKGEAEREAGEGSVELDLTIEAQAEGLFELEGARPGVDGTYRTETVKHKASRSGGATTSLDLKQPSKGAGKDKRKGDDDGDSDVTLAKHPTLG